MTLEQPRLDLIFFRLYRHFEVEATEREPPDIFLVRRFPFIAQDKYLFFNASAHRHNRNGQGICFFFVNELVFMENVILVTRQMTDITVREQELELLLYTERLDKDRGESRNLKSVSVPGAAIVVSHRLSISLREIYWVRPT